MADLPKTTIVFLSTGKGTWREALRIVRSAENPIILVASYAAERVEKDAQIPGIKIAYQPDLPVRELQEAFKTALKEHIADGGEVGVSIVSGSGKEHAALISALMHIPVSFRLITLEEDTPILLS